MASHLGKIFLQGCFGTSLIYIWYTLVYVFSAVFYYRFSTNCLVCINKIYVYINIDMKTFKCIRCGADFDRKNKLAIHYERKKTCKPIEIDIPIDILKEVIDEPNDNVLREVLKAKNKNIYYSYLENILKKSSEKTIYQYIPESAKSQKNINKSYTRTGEFLKNKHQEPESSINLIEKTRQKDKLNCKYCNMTFKSYASRVRHENHRCPSRQKDNIPINLDDKQLEKPIYNREQLILTVLNDQTILDDIKDSLPIELDRDEIIEAVLGDETILNDIKKLTQVDSKTSNSHNTTNSHNMINSNNTNNTTVNINQNAYGQEKFDYIVNDKKIEAYLENLADTNTRKFFIELFKIAFFSPKHPENKTFKLENDKSLVIKILKELPDRWIYASKKETIQKKVEQILGFITDHTTIVTDGSKTDQTIEDITAETKPAFTEAMKEFETMEILNYKNKKLLEEKKTATLLNKKIF